MQKPLEIQELARVVVVINSAAGSIEAARIGFVGVAEEGGFGGGVRRRTVRARVVE